MDGGAQLDDELEPELVLPATARDGADPDGELVLSPVHRGERALLEAVTRALSDEFAVRGGGLEFRTFDALFGWDLRDGGRLVCRVSGRARAEVVDQNIRSRAASAKRVTPVMMTAPRRRSMRIRCSLR